MGSVYLDKEAVIFGESTIELRSWLAPIGIEPNLTQKEPEDHIGLMLMLLSYLVEHKEDSVQEYLENHLFTWCFRYLEVFYKACGNYFYKGLYKLALLTFQGWKEDYNINIKKVKYYF